MYLCLVSCLLLSSLMRPATCIALRCVPNLIPRSFRAVPIFFWLLFSTIMNSIRNFTLVSKFLNFHKTSGCLTVICLGKPCSHLCHLNFKVPVSSASHANFSQHRMIQTLPSQIYGWDKSKWNIDTCKFAENASLSRV